MDCDLFTIDNVGETELLEENNKYENASIKFHSKIDPLDNATSPNTDEVDKIEEIEEDDNMSDLDFGDLPRNTVDISKVIKLPPQPKKSELQRNMDKFCKVLEKYLQTDNRDSLEDEDDNNFSRTDVEKELKTCVTNGIEKKKAIEYLTERQRIKRGKEERSKSKGKNWFNLPATEMTDEVKNDLEIIQMRSVLDPQHFYKKNDLKALPKYFQIGKVLPSPLDYYNERDTRKSKRKTLVDELMEDAQFQRFNKRKYTEAIQQQKNSGFHKANKKMKKLKKNKS